MKKNPAPEVKKEAPQPPVAHPSEAEDPGERTVLLQRPTQFEDSVDRVLRKHRLKSA